MSSEELLPCPFCGSRAEMRYVSATGMHYIVCTNAQCRCRTGQYTKPSVMLRWGRRVNDER